MAIGRGSYPHPVLDDSDDVGSTFKVFNVTIAPTVDDIEISFTVATDDPTLEELVRSGKARYSFRWRCGATMATGELEPEIQQHLASGKRYVVRLDQREVRRSVAVGIRVVATTDTPDFRWERQHADYGDATFSLKVGDVMADGGRARFEVDKLFDPLDPPVGSCFQFVAVPNLRRRMTLSFHDDEYVQVRFPEPLLAGLRALGSKPDLQISAIVLPALVETIYHLRDARLDSVPDDAADKLWARAITAMVERHGGFDESPLALAQTILGDPIDRTLELALLMGDAEEDE